MGISPIMHHSHILGYYDLSKQESRIFLWIAIATIYFFGIEERFCQLITLADAADDDTLNP